MKLSFVFKGKKLVEMQEWFQMKAYNLFLSYLWILLVLTRSENPLVLTVDSICYIHKQMKNMTT